MPCSDPPPKVEEAPAWHYTPETVDENRTSLFGRASALNLAVPSKEDASADPEKGRGATSGGVNPMTPKGSFSVPKGDKSTNGSGDSSPSSPKAGAKKALLPKKDEEEEEEGEGSDDSNAAEAKAKAKRKKAKKETSQAITAAAAEESD